jgi:hypothetical protein
MLVVTIQVKETARRHFEFHSADVEFDVAFEALNRDFTWHLMLRDSLASLHHNPDDFERICFHESRRCGAANCIAQRPYIKHYTRFRVGHCHGVILKNEMKGTRGLSCLHGGMAAAAS